MEKAGFEYERDVVHTGSLHLLYRINAPEAQRAFRAAAT
jgi:hypothetical protein